MNWANRTVFTGDNLDVMRGMDSETVDLIYADPPFNSNRTYAAPIGSEAAGAAFKDTWTLDDIDEAWLEIIRDQHPGPHAVIEAAGIVHGDGMKSYLCMMAIRLLEMRRLLKPTGSLYLHCDGTAAHYLKLLLDGVLGMDNFRSGITWQRTSSHNDGRQGRKQHGRVCDTILFYSRGKTWTWNPVFMPYDQTYIDRFYRHAEPETGRRYQLSDMTGRGGAAKGNPRYEVMGVTRYWCYSQARMDQLIAEGRIVQTAPGRVPRYKRYLDEMPGKSLQDLWADIPPVSPAAGERVGYPTQKPVALLDRVVASSSPPDGVVFDPFCGCATALVAAERLTRQWVGIDISPLAVKLVRQRLRREVPLFTQDAIDRTDVPTRTDLVDELREYLSERDLLFSHQKGHCAGCRVFFEMRNLEVDHVIPRVKGGPDHISNYQLLCGSCNRRKGTGSQAELIAKLKRDGIIAA